MQTDTFLPIALLASSPDPRGAIRVSLWENSLRFFTRGLRIFGADRFQLKLKKSCHMRYFSSIRIFAQHCEFCCAKITYNVIFSSFFAQQNSHRGLKRNQQFYERISEELFSLCERKKSHRGLKRNPQFDEEDCRSRTFDKRPSRFRPRQAGRTWCAWGGAC